MSKIPLVALNRHIPIVGSQYNIESGLLKAETHSASATK
jgi:hypothetical protein